MLCIVVGDEGIPFPSLQRAWGMLYIVVGDEEIPFPSLQRAWGIRIESSLASHTLQSQEKGPCVVVLAIGFDLVQSDSRFCLLVECVHIVGPTLFAVPVYPRHFL